MSVYGNFTTESGTPIVVGVVITKGANKNVITKIRTVHARGDFERQITDNSVLFLGEDKKETKAWFRLLGIEVPLEGKTFGFIRSLSQNEPNVNMKYEKDSEGNTLPVGNRNFSMSPRLRIKTETFSLLIYRNRLRMIYKAYALICL